MKEFRYTMPRNAYMAAAIGGILIGLMGITVWSFGELSLQESRIADQSRVQLMLEGRIANLEQEILTNRNLILEMKEELQAKEGKGSEK